MGCGRNYKEQGGDRWVIGGDLEIKEGARVTGIPFSVAKSQKETKAKDIEALVADFNSLITKLKEAGLME